MTISPCFYYTDDIYFKSVSYQTFTMQRECKIPLWVLTLIGTFQTGFICMFFLLFLNNLSEKKVGL